MEDLTYEDAIQAFHDLTEGLSGDSPEYERGGVNLIADLWGKPGVDTGTRMDEVEADIRAYNGADLTEALRRLYQLNDGDEAGVGEVEVECHKVARLTYLDRTEV